MLLGGGQPAVRQQEGSQPSSSWDGMGWGWVFKHLSFCPDPVQVCVLQQPRCFVGESMDLSSEFLHVLLAEAQIHLDIFEKL